jgi:hypothetical protein
LKQFEHAFIELPELKDELVEGVGRIYTTPEGNKYPSVTTILAASSDQSWKEKWINAVGEEEASKVSKRATLKGTALHEIAESYLRNNQDYTKGHMIPTIYSFNKIKHLLDDHITKIYGLELPLYSDSLKVAGRCDLIAEWDGIPSIIDFKTSSKEKEREDIHSYFLQESIYSYMFYERTGILCKNLVTLMVVESGTFLVFKEKARNWLPQFIELRKRSML